MVNQQKATREERKKGKQQDWNHKPNPFSTNSKSKRGKLRVNISFIIIIN